MHHFHSTPTKTNISLIYTRTGAEKILLDIQLQLDSCRDQRGERGQKESTTLPIENDRMTGNPGNKSDKENER